MKTILVVFVKDKETTVESVNVKKCKKYSYVTGNNLQVGDVLESPNYDSFMLVTDVIDHEYKYYNASTGALTDEIDYASCYPIRVLKLVESKALVVATKVN